MPVSLLSLVQIKFGIGITFIDFITCSHPIHPSSSLMRPGLRAQRNCRFIRRKFNFNFLNLHPHQQLHQTAAPSIQASLVYT